MAVEDFHFAPYVLESASANPDFSVFLRHCSPYLLEAAAANAEFSVFVNSCNSYSLEGREKASAQSLRLVKSYLIESVELSQPNMTQTRAYSVLGGFRNLTPYLKVPEIAAYEIFTV